MKTYAEIMNRMAHAAHQLEDEARAAAIAKPGTPDYRKTSLFVMQRRHDIETLAGIAKMGLDDILSAIQREEREIEMLTREGLKIPLMGARARLALLQWALD